MKKAILLLSLVLVVFFSGCVGEPTEELPYKNDIITIEEYYASDRTPYEGAVVLVELVLKNNGEESVPRTKVEFDASGFTIEDLSCEGIEIKEDLNCEGVIGEIKGDDCYCVFDGNNEIESLENGGERRVILTLQVPPRGLLHSYTLSLSYSIEYDYSGFRKMDIPIIDGETLKKPLSEYSQSTATYGPILLTFELPPRGEHVEEGQTIKEYWGVRDTPFNVKMEFTHVGSKSIGTIREPKIEEDMVKLDLRGSLEIAYSVNEEGDKLYLPCYFDVGTGGYLFSNKEIKVPGELMCNLQSTVFKDGEYEEPETRATIWAEFDYRYHYTNSQDFEIQPII